MTTDVWVMVMRDVGVVLVQACGSNEGKLYLRSSPSVLIAISEIQNHFHKNLRGGPPLPLG